VLIFQQSNPWRSAVSIISYLLIDILYWWLHLKTTDFYFIWFIPGLLFWYSMLHWKLGPDFGFEQPNRSSADDPPEKP